MPTKPKSQLATNARQAIARANRLQEELEEIAKNLHQYADDIEQCDEEASMPTVLRSIADGIEED